MNTDNTHTSNPIVAETTQRGQRRKRTRALIAGAAIIAGLLLAACSPSRGAATTPSSTNADQPSSVTSSPAPVSSDAQLAPNFQITVYQGQEELGGQTVELSDLLAQGKPVVLNFWAGLCPPCRLEMPDLQAVHDQYQGEVLLFGLDVGVFTGLGTQGDGLALLQELGITYPAGTTSDAEVVRSYQVIGMPTTYFIKPNGEIVNKWTGVLTEEKLAELTQELLEASKS